MKKSWISSTDNPARIIILSERREIDATMRGESLRKIDGLKMGELAAVEILVPAADEALAKHLLESADAGDFQLTEDDEHESS